MSARSALRHLLDPVGGDDLASPNRTLMLNLRRTELAAVAMIFNAAIEGTFAIFRQSALLIALASFVVLVGCVFVVVARRAQWSGATSIPCLPEIFVIFALCASHAAGYLLSGGGRIAVGNAMVFLAAAAFFLIPPRRFALIGAATFTCYVLWVSSLDATVFDKAVGIFNTGLGVIAGIFGRRSLHRMQQVELGQRRQIAEQNERLVESNAELNGLMAIAAHDLRSPLFGLRNLLGLAASRRAISAQAMRGLLIEANSSIDAMLELIGRMLEAHAAEEPTEPVLQLHDLRERLANLRERIGPMAERNRIELVLRCPSHPVSARVDAEMLDQILDNLVSNAIRFSPAGSRVELRAGIADGSFIEIADNGIGIPENERALLFTKFRRGRRQPLNGHRGSGLGLYIVRTLAQAMQVKVGYEPGAGGGSTFRLELEHEPCDRRHDPATSPGEFRASRESSSVSTGI